MSPSFGPQGKNLPEMAAPTSEFSQFLAMEARMQPWFANLLDQDIDAAFDVAWTRYTRQHGDPAMERARRLDVERRKAASLEDATGLTPEMAGITKPGGSRSLYEIYKDLEGRNL